MFIRKPVKFLVYLILGLVVLISLFPFYWTFISSITPVSKIFSYPPSFYPQEPTLINYLRLKVYIPTIWQNIMNSAILAIFTPVASVFLESLAAFAFSKLKFKGRDLLFGLVIATMLIPASVGFIPLFIIEVNLHLIDSLWAVFLPGAVGAFGIFLFRQAMYAVPDELMDAGRIDGASDFVLYYAIILPNVKPMVITAYILGFIASWNNYFWPLIVLRTQEKLTFPVALSALQTQPFESPWGSIMAGAVLLILPVLIIFAMLSRYIVPEIGGAIKG
jgi:ABC-type glycerol-3-phosphate transport system permease component